MTGDVTYRDLFGQLEKFLNTSGKDEFEQLCDKMMKDLHPRLQQRFTQLCANWLTYLAIGNKNNLGFDPRIQDSRVLGREFYERFGEVRLPLV